MNRKSISEPENHYLETLFVECLQLLGHFLAEVPPVIFTDWKCGCPLGAYQRAILSITNIVPKGNPDVLVQAKANNRLTMSKAATLLDCFNPACL